MEYRNLKSKKEVYNYLDSLKNRVTILSHFWNDENNDIKLRRKYADLWFEYLGIYHKLMIIVLN